MRYAKFSGVPLVVIVTAVVMQMINSFAVAAYTPSKSVITLTGIGAAPACPGGWTEIVPQTAAGTFSPLTSVTTTSMAPITSISTWSTFKGNSGTSAEKLCAAGDPDHSARCGAGLETAQTLASGGSATTYSVANGGAATTYTYYYRVCEK